MIGIHTGRVKLTGAEIRKEKAIRQSKAGKDLKRPQKETEAFRAGTEAGPKPKSCSAGVLAQSGSAAMLRKLSGSCLWVGGQGDSARWHCRDGLQV